MSVRNLSNQPCPDCKEETLHNAMRCTRCGHINMTPTQHRQVGYKKIIRGRSYKMRQQGGQAATEVREQKQTIRAAKRQERLKAIDQQLHFDRKFASVRYRPGADQGIFGKRRGNRP